MACIDAPIPPIPDLPTGLSLGLPIPSPPFPPELCCKILTFTPHPLPPLPPLPPAVLAAIADVLALKLRLMEAYLDALSFKCPREAEQVIP